MIQQPISLLFRSDFAELDVDTLFATHSASHNDSSASIVSENGTEELVENSWK